MVVAESGPTLGPVGPAGGRAIEIEFADPLIGLVRQPATMSTVFVLSGCGALQRQPNSKPWLPTRPSSRYRSVSVIVPPVTGCWLKIENG